jgi:RNA polymerase sigma-70 factor (ECF subfamily)
MVIKVAISTANSLFSLPISGAKTVEANSTTKQAASVVALLTRRLAAGDEEAFREFHQLYFDRLYQFLLVVAHGQEHEAQDALQEMLLRVVRYVRVFESDDAFWDWLKVVARSAARDGGRKKRRYFSLLQKFSLRCDVGPAEEGHAEESRLRELMHECLNELAPEDRGLIEAKYILGKTVREMATSAGLTERSVESRLLRSRRALRELALKKLRYEATE